MDLSRISCLMQFRNADGLWHARALDSDRYAHGETPEEAVEAALAPVAPRRRVVVAAPPAPRRRPVQGGFFDT